MLEENVSQVAKGNHNLNQVIIFSSCISILQSIIRIPTQMIGVFPTTSRCMSCHMSLELPLINHTRCTEVKFIFWQTNHKMFPWKGGNHNCLIIRIVEGTIFPFLWIVNVIHHLCHALVNLKTCRWLCLKRGRGAQVRETQCPEIHKKKSQLIVTMKSR